MPESERTSKNDETVTGIVPKPCPLKFGGVNNEAAWIKFKQEWDAYEKASGLLLKTNTERVVTLLRVLGEDALNVYKTFYWSDHEDSRNLDEVIKKFEQLTLSEKEVRFHRYLFYKREQLLGEKLDRYVSDIAELAEFCDFGDMKERFICDKIIFGLNDTVLRGLMLSRTETQRLDLVETIQKAQKDKSFLETLAEKYKAKLKEEIIPSTEERKGTNKMADDAVMLDPNEEVDYEPEYMEEKDELILKADSDIEEIEPDDESSQSSQANSNKDQPVVQTTREKEFTSEDFKIEIRGLPRYYSMAQLKKLLNEVLQLKAHKIKPGGHNKDWGYVTFRDEKSRDRALVVLDGYEWKKNTLTSSIAKAVEDPVAKRNLPVDPKMPDEDVDDKKMPMRERVVKSVTPCAQKTYEDQLLDKQKAANSALRRIGSEMVKNNPELKQFAQFHKLRRRGQVCEMMDIVPSPVVEGYRNKCEFTIGVNPEDGLATVGFRVSSYKNGCIAVGPVDHVIHIPDNMKEVVKVFQEYVRNSDHKPFSPLTHDGVWRQLTVRTSSHNDILIAVVIHPQKLSEEELGGLKENVVEFFKDLGGSSAGVTSIYFQVFGQKQPGPEDQKYEHVWGEEYITETVLGKTFRISCESFFQVNTKACEVLYDTIATLAELDGTSVILDICCGTGTIGVSLADQCLKVYGIEMVKKAAEDARHNAELNGLENVAIYTGKAEVNLNAVLAQCVKYTTIGVVDPPRAGLAESVIKALRKCENMNRMIYMSCDPDGAYKNFMDLTRPKSKNYKGEFFVPIKAVAVDMFPQTAHYELLIVFERWEERKWRRIMEGNPLPRDEEYYKRIPPKPEGAVETYESDEDEEEEIISHNTGMGTWTKSSSGKRKNKESYQPYTNPRQQSAKPTEMYGGNGRSGGQGKVMSVHRYPTRAEGGLGLMGDSPSVLDRYPTRAEGGLGLMGDSPSVLDRYPIRAVGALGLMGSSPFNDEYSRNQRRDFSRNDDLEAYRHPAQHSQQDLYSRGHSNQDRGFSDHNRGNSDHSRGFGDHNRGFNDHSRGFDDHSRGFSDHNRGFSDHNRGFSDHNRGSNDHSRSFSDSNRGYGDNSRGYNDHNRGYNDYNRGLQSSGGLSSGGLSDHTRSHNDPYRLSRADYDRPSSQYQQSFMDRVMRF